MSELSEFQEEVGKWGNDAFNHDESSLHSMCAHLMEEVNEIKWALPVLYVSNSTRPGIAEELADCLILLLDMAHISEIDLLQAARDKMEINRKRTWKKPDKNGVIKHLEEK